MAINTVNLPALPRCEGSQWFVGNRRQLVTLTGMIMLGRAQHAADILNGTQPVAPVAASALKARLRRLLIIPANADPWHRDGLLFETICWLVAKIEAGPDDAISDPHRRATQQGADGLRVRFDPITRTITTATVYEYKCTDKARRQFKRNVLPAFAEYLSGERDDDLTQTAISLLSRYNLTNQEKTEAYERLVLDRPLAFEASMTVFPAAFPVAKCKKLFKDYEGINIPIDRRRGNTFPIPNIRGWFDAFAVEVWDWIDANV